MNASGIIRTFGIVVLLAGASVQCSKIHDQMTDDEIANIFHTTRDEIPQYVVAPVWHNRYKRADQNLRVKFTAFGVKMDTYLNPSDGQLMGANTPVWLAFTNPNGTVEYMKMQKGIVGRATSRFFIDHSHFSAIAVNHLNGEEPSFYGILGNLIIRPLPRRLQKESRSRRNSEAPNTSRTMIDTHDHVIIKSTSVTEPEGLEREIRETSSRVKRSNQEIIYPSVMVQTDYTRSKKTLDEADHYDEIIYQLALWHSVDLRFRQVNDPKIRIRIAGIIIGLDRDAAPYLQNDVDTPSKKVQQIGEHWYKMSQRPDFPPEAYHIVITITDTFRGKFAHLVNVSPGFCRPTAKSQYQPVGLVYDAGGFHGILVTTVSLGLILGLSVDPKDGDECGVANGFIMAKKISPLSSKNLKWSPCSLKDFTATLRKSYIDCADKPAEFYPPGRPIQKILPGEVSTPHEQCQALGFQWACDPSPDMCAQRQCHYTGLPAFKNGWWCKDAGPAIEGTTCAPGRKCVDGVCQCMTAECMYCSVDPEE